MLIMQCQDTINGEWLVYLAHHNDNIDYFSMYESASVTKVNQFPFLTPHKINLSLKQLRVQYEDGYLFKSRFDYQVEGFFM